MWFPDVPCIRSSSLPPASPISRMSLRHARQVPIYRNSPIGDQDAIEQRLFEALATVRTLRDALADTEVLAEVEAGAVATLTSAIAGLERSCELCRWRSAVDI